MDLINLTQKETLLDSDYLHSKDGGIDYKETRQQQHIYHKNKFDQIYTSKKTDNGTYVMKNGIWVNGYDKTETDNLLSKKFDYKEMPANTDPTQLSDGAYKWTWNSGGQGMPYVLTGDPMECACIVLNGIRTLSIREATSNLNTEFRYSGTRWYKTTVLPKSFSGATTLYIGADSADSWNTLITGIPSDLQTFITQLRIEYTATSSTNCTYVIFSGAMPSVFYSLRSTQSNRSIIDNITFIGDGNVLYAGFISGTRTPATISFSTSIYFPKLQ